MRTTSHKIENINKDTEIIKTDTTRNPVMEKYNKLNEKFPRETQQ